MEGLPIADELDEIRAAEEHNYQTSLRLLGDSVSLVQDLLDLYKFLTASATKSDRAARDEFLTGAHFLQAARYQLTIGSLATLRAHIADALRGGRIAIEVAAFAARVKRQPDLALVWLNAGQGDDAYERYRRIFSGQKMFPEEDPVLAELGRRFDTTSKLTHPSVYALAEHSRITRTDRRLDIQFHYFPVKGDDPSEPTRTFLWTVDTHFGVLRVFENVLGELLSADDRRTWDLRRNGVDGKLLTHKARWKEIILRKPKPETVDPSALVIIPPF